MMEIVNDMLVGKLFPQKQFIYDGLHPSSKIYPGEDVYPSEMSASGALPKKTGLRMWFKENTII